MQIKNSRSKAVGQSGFTLIELLVVISIIALLVAILLPSLTQARSVARDLRCKTNLRGFGDAIYSYQTDYKGYYPPGYDYQPTYLSSWTAYISDYMNTMKGDPNYYGVGYNFQSGTLRCPEDNETNAHFSGYGANYVGMGLIRFYNTTNWVGSNLVAKNGFVQDYYANASGDGSVNFSTPIYPGVTYMDPKSPYIVEMIGDNNGIAYASYTTLNALGSMRLRHGTPRAASGLGNRLNYVSVDLGVATADFSSVPDAALTQNLTSLYNWYEVGAYAGFQTINGYYGQALNPLWPYGQGMTIARDGLVKQ